MDGESERVQRQRIRFLTLYDKRSRYEQARLLHVIIPTPDVTPRCVYPAAQLLRPNAVQMTVIYLSHISLERRAAIQPCEFAPAPASFAVKLYPTELRSQMRPNPSVSCNAGRKRSAQSANPIVCSVFLLAPGRTTLHIVFHTQLLMRLDEFVVVVACQMETLLIREL